MKKTVIKTAAAVIFLLHAIAPAYAVDTSLQPGRYESAFGDLLIERLPDHALSFKIISVGRTGHICDLGGGISGNQAQMNRHCVVRFRAHHRSIEVQSEGAACAEYCGAGAVFARSYDLPARGCASGAQTKAREDFQLLYAKQDYHLAVERLSPVLTRCVATLAWLERIQLSLDLADAQYRAGDFAGCKTTLQPWRTDTLLDDATLDKQWGGDSPFPPLIRAVRDSINLCETAGDRRIVPDIRPASPLR